MNAEVWVDQCPGVIIDNVHVRLFSGNAGGSSVITVSLSDNTRITNSVSSDSCYQNENTGMANTKGITIGNSNGVIVENCNASDNGGCGIYLYHQAGFAACDGNTIKNCKFDNNFFGAGIVIESANGNTITGNEVRGNYNGIEITDGYYHISALSHDNLLYNNTVTDSELEKWCRCQCSGH